MSNWILDNWRRKQEARKKDREEKKSSDQKVWEDGENFTECVGEEYGDLPTVGKAVKGIIVGVLVAFVVVGICVGIGQENLFTAINNSVESPIERGAIWLSLAVVFNGFMK